MTLTQMRMRMLIMAARRRGGVGKGSRAVDRIYSE